MNQACRARRAVREQEDRLEQVDHLGRKVNLAPWVFKATTAMLAPRGRRVKLVLLELKEMKDSLVLLERKENLEQTGSEE